MNQLENLIYLAQTSGGQVFTEGMQVSDALAIAIDPEQGLLAMARGCSEHADPQKVIEILIDDMQVNLPPLESRDASTDTELASRCLTESYDNINEYLLGSVSGNNEPDESCVSLASIQFVNNRLSCAVVGEYCCLNFSEDKIITMNDIYDLNLRGDRALGLKMDFKMNVTQHPIRSEQIVFMAPLDVVQTIGEEHIRLTLGRFHDNFDMALRQINTRAAKRGLGCKPALIIARVEAYIEQNRGWLGRLRRKPPK